MNIPIVFRFNAMMPRTLAQLVCLSGLLLLPPGVRALKAAELGSAFPTPEAAVEALMKAAQSTDREVLRSLFGLDTDELVAVDQVQATNEFARFFAAGQEARHLVHESEERCVLEVGGNRWPFPIPIVRVGSQWHYDTEAGKEELLNRRIGRNELAVLKVARVYVDAQREYASQDRDDDLVLEYATKFASSEGRKDGLYWPLSLDGEISPLGPLVAFANEEGYRKQSETGPEPFHGYFYRILTRQGKHAPGGDYGYVINGNMIGGFALVAWPAQYGESGIMTFVVNQQGRVYQKDLGAKTSTAAAAISVYNPDDSWTVSPD